MDSSKTASRIGGLTVALGLGLAVSSGQGVAHADTDAADGGSAGPSASAPSSTADSSSASGPAGSAPAPQRITPTRRSATTVKIRENGPIADSSPSIGVAQRKTQIRRTTPAQAAETAKADQTAVAAETTQTATDAEVSVKDAEVSVKYIDTTPVTVDKPRVDKPDINKEAVSTAVTTETNTDVTAEQPVVTDVDETTDPTKEPVDPAETVDTVRADGPAAPPTTGSGNAPVNDKNDVTVSTPKTQAPVTGIDVVAAHDRDTITGAPATPVAVKTTDSGSTAVDPQPTAPQSVVKTPVLSPIAAIVAAPARLVAGLLGWVGLAPQATAPGIPFTPFSDLLELAWVAMRRWERFLFNTAPTATIEVGQPDSNGVVTGKVIGHDAEGDQLSYRLISQPQNGTVVLDPDGSFTYTPTAGTIQTGAVDTFKVAVIDRGFHLHGLLSFLKPDGGHASFVTVSVSQISPEIRSDSIIVDYASGVVTGIVHVTGHGGVDLKVTPIDPSRGIVELHRVDDTIWKWTFTPTDQARAEAGLPDGVKSVAITIGSTDGRLSPVSVQAPITPQPESAPIIASYETITLPPGYTGTNVIAGPDGTVVVLGPQPNVIVLNQNLLIVPPPTPLTITPISVHTNEYTGQTIIVDQQLIVSTVVVSGSSGGITVVPTGVVLTQQPTDITSVGGNLVVATGSGLDVYGQGGEKLVVTGLDNNQFKEVETISNTEVVATSQHAVSRLMLINDLGEARMMGAANAGAPTVMVEETAYVDFGDGVVGELAVRGEIAYVTVTEGGTTRLAKIDFLEMVEASSVELSGTASSLAISADGKYAYVTDDAAGTVTVIRIYENGYDYYGGFEIVQTINTGGGKVTALPNGGFAITNPANGTVSILKHAEQGPLD